MGMDVYGNEPTAPEGEYFQRSVWGWHPLAELCEDLAPDICCACCHWHSNDGDGLDENHAEALARVLAAALDDGRVTAWIADRNTRLAAMPNEICTICDGTGVRTDALGVKTGDPERTINSPGHPRHGHKGWCNGCDGRGWNRPFACHYTVAETDVREFQSFLSACGGFEIH